MIKQITITYSKQDGGYIAESPDYPVISAFGETPRVALRELEYAISGELDKED